MWKNRGGGARFQRRGPVFSFLCLHGRALFFGTGQFESGFFQVLMGVFDLASAVRFLSQPTLSGFVTGGAVLIIVSQLKGFFGYTQFPHAGGPFQKVLACIQQIHQANWVNVGLCSCLILIIVSCKRLKATAKREQKQSLIWRMAGRVAQIKEILVVVFGILFVRLTKQEDGSTLVPSVGYIPEGLPPLRLPWQLNATEKLLNGPADVLHGFVLSGAIVAFSTFLTLPSCTFACTDCHALLFPARPHRLK